MFKFASSVLVIALAISSQSVSGSPLSEKRLTVENVKRQNLLPKCGTTGDATLSDCRALLDQWPAFGNFDATCTYSVTQTAYNPACLGNCCVYTTQNQMRWNNRDDPNDGADVKSAVQALLGCASEEKNSVNGVVTLDEDKGERVCIGDRAACGDCFSD